MPLFRPKRKRRKKKSSSSKNSIPPTQYNSDSYKEWRLKVFRRDKFTCQICHRKKSKDVSIEAHHILRKADFPQLTLCITNGITLCTDCHRVITGNEYFWAKQLMGIIKGKKPKLLPPSIQQSLVG